MLRALFSGVSGLKAHQTKMDVIGNNIANVNTYGYKSQRVTFKDSFYETLSSSSEANADTGGGNPSQVGLGAVINTIDVLHTRGGYVPTGQPMDVFIQGEGYLVARDSMGNESYTRVGNLKFDGAGNLVDGNKRYICGYPLQRYDAPAAAKAATSELAGATINFGDANASFFNGFKIRVIKDDNAPAPKAEYNTNEKFITLTAKGTDLDALTSAQLEAALQNMSAAKDTPQLPTAIQSGLTNIKVTGVLGTVPDGLTTNAAIGGVSKVDAKGATATAGGLSIDFGAGNGSTFNDIKIQFVEKAGQTTAAAKYDAGNKLITVEKESLANLTATEIQTALRGATNLPAGAGTNITVTGTNSTITNGFSTTLTGGLAAVTAVPSILDDHGMKIKFTSDNAEFFNGTKVVFKSTPGAATSAVYDAGSKKITINAADLSSLTPAEIQTALRAMTLPAGAGTPTIDVSGTIGSPVDGDFSATAAGGEAAHNRGDVVFKTIPSVGATITTGMSTVSFGDSNGAFFNGYQIKAEKVNPGTLPKGVKAVATYNIASKTITMKTEGNNVSEEDMQAALRAMQAEDGTAVMPNIIDLSAIKVEGGGSGLQSGTTTTKAIKGQDISQSTTLDKTHGVQQIKKPGTMVDTNGDGIYDSEVNDVMNLKGIQIGENGVITGEDDNGFIVQVGQIALANLANPEALTLDGNSYMNAVSNTGTVTYTVPGSGVAGVLKSNGLENSNVDLANEFSDMIMTQRGFQANSRIITVGDEMLQELVNLKR